MKQSNYLKWLRVLLAALFFIPIFLLFVDFAVLIPTGVSGLLHAQIIPAFLGGFIGLFILQLVLGLVFGRIYCSTLCPAGVLQDIINHLFCIGKKKKNGIYRFKYTKPMNLLRYGLLGLTIVLAIFGVTELLVWLDPYSNFGRIGSSLFRPAVIWINNLLADVMMSMDNYTFYHVTIKTVTTASLVAAITILLTFMVMVIFRGRLFCNTLCPVGGLLSLVSRYSLFKISFDKHTCNSCGICERTCKAEAIDSKEMQVDISRCVDCFNCLGSCKKGSLQYRFTPSFRKATEVQPVSSTDQMVNTRRSFLATGATVAATLPVVSAVAKTMKSTDEDDVESRHWPPVLPPGAINVERFKGKCTGCHVCVTKCPSQVLRPAGLQYGFGYLLRPYVSYHDSYCNYECTICSQVCPTHALKPLTVDEKVTTQIGIATFFIDRCIVNTEETDCGACSEHCPTQAVHMVPYKGTLTIPHVEPDLCIGCGGCESICPVNPDRAIIIKSNLVHQYVEKPPEEEALDIEIDGFGF
ncbi:MAG: 4Fe-4S dicluster domain-containing protein [Tannerellaceae bacterium]|nr:4Fe-4S dicluster domain-containing protein [Tannerellaceae bacterium]